MTTKNDNWIERDIYFNPKVGVFWLYFRDLGVCMATVEDYQWTIQYTGRITKDQMSNLFQMITHWMPILKPEPPEDD